MSELPTNIRCPKCGARERHPESESLMQVFDCGTTYQMGLCHTQSPDCYSTAASRKLLDYTIMLQCFLGFAQEGKIPDESNINECRRLLGWHELVEPIVKRPEHNLIRCPHCQVKTKVIDGQTTYCTHCGNAITYKVSSWLRADSTAFTKETNQ